MKRRLMLRIMVYGGHFCLISVEIVNTVLRLPLLRNYLFITSNSFHVLLEIFMHFVAVKAKIQ